jgi:hypothetical protein
VKLWHYTCIHSSRSIAESGLVLPASAFISFALPPWSSLVWLTDLAEPVALALGLTNRILSCDRTACRFQVLDETNVRRWTEAHEWRRTEWGHQLEAVAGCLPRHWYVTDQPVRVASA